jgi:methionine-rich copper-binding protein CopC
MFTVISTRRALGALALFALFAAVCLLPRATGVSAHAKFDHGTPNDGDVISSAPSQIDAYFADDIVKQVYTYGLAVFDPSGNEVVNQDTVLDDSDRRHMTVTLQSGLGDGAYIVYWWTVSDEDGDAARGSYAFSVASS